MTAARPFLKWAGGKGQLLDRLRPYYAGDRFDCYHEPFVGSGAVLFDLLAHSPGTRIGISDTNWDLVTTYRVVRDDVDGLCASLAHHQEMHNKPAYPPRGAEEHYYRTRAWVPGEDVETAARLIYLNRTCFNGLYRVNKRGLFNVPIGRYANPKILDAENLRAVSCALQRVHVHCGDFEVLCNDVEGPGDLVYLDPPYDPLPGKQSFTAYSGAFGWEDQVRLARVFRDLSATGARVVLSNSDTPRIRELYRDFHVTEVRATRRINSKASARGTVSELIVSNYRPEAIRHQALAGSDPDPELMPDALRLQERP